MKALRKIGAIITHKCPRCHEGPLFETSTFSFSKAFHMPGHCTTCRLNYHPEPGFYYGAMFISYILTAFYCLGFMGVAIFVFHSDIENAFLLLFVTLLVFYIWIYRTARAVWIHLNIRYDPDAIVKAKDLPDLTKMPGYVHRNF
jgi:uncharacterized protein (DUF983 family)